MGHCAGASSLASSRDFRRPRLRFSGENAMPHDNRHWFPAKRYGWGWGIPITWEGWLALLAFIGLVVASLLIAPPQRSLVGFVAYVVVLGIVFSAVCWWKGEPPRWRWGDD
jgi:hypothetical protein